MKALLGLAAASALLTALPGLACTPDEIDLKARELAINVHMLTHSDPRLAEEIYREIRSARPEYTAEELPNECAAYERRLLELEKAAAQAETNWRSNYY
ncbi:hypothetical protein AvCA_34630 [Azotobacter vinelandii CA]|uniref:Lipoprotein n=2 Tax=Azotobacter vinelandii TaxID=354 RepID=C1DQH6_AZOVD|nr:hypothetical protein [Azotobacter vinelandii]ACO79612.1 conserved hypothetical protein [Azotobacter vinelandii DJ]AGK14637.1 hypothetical protein AvCA_34630 [Azotobacter vinelandii CA]AGK21357.1 hypothetical protein AvCA6_34630 [Azotobacter vinelandii CA6]SFX25029.1 hypothetical protein SAMN04244547_00889 [Azotobacter vinelandii]GLK57996.1 hypothetical protein GCM10017624_01530 [Azotobacter vinelandii]